MTCRALRVSFLILFVNASVALGQSSASPTRDPRALSLVAASLKALAPATTLSDITLQGSATYTAGSDLESGSVTLLASGNLLSNMALGLTNGPRSEIRSGPAGQWSGPDSTPHAMALHNCWTDADWFYPGMSFQALSTDAGLGINYVGPESKNGLPVVHLQLFRVVPGQAASVATTILTLSTEDLYLDPASSLPLFLDFNVHADNDINHSFAVEVAFLGYQNVGGVMAPARIQKYLNGSLLLDLVITSAKVNSGLPASDFVVTVQPQ